MAQAASATSGAHFFSATSSIDDNGALVVSWDEAGVGQEQVNYQLTVATATAIYACINGGGNHPKAANKETVSAWIRRGGGCVSSGGEARMTSGAGLFQAVRAAGALQRRSPCW
jgi:hypothetical protein